MNKRIVVLGLAALLILAAAAIADWTPYGTINMRNTYNITNVPWVNGTSFNASGYYYGNGSQLTDITASDLSCTDCIDGTEIAVLTDADVSNTLTCSDLIAAANVDIGSYELRAQTLEADVATGTSPFTIASTTQVANLNVSYSGTAYDLTCTNCIGGTEISELADADVSNTLTCSDLVAGTSVVADAEVDDDLTINTDKFINTTAGMKLSDNDKIYFGTGDDVSMYYNSTHFIISG